MARRFRFGLFALDAEREELRREGVLVRLQAQPMQLLTFLVERAGQVVTREDLRKAVWGEGTFVDFDGGLNFCISQIRSALQDDAAQPLYVRTVPKSGYQFIAPLERIAEQPDSSQPAAARSQLAHDSSKKAGSAAELTAEETTGSQQAVPTSARSRVWLWLAAGGVLVVGAVVGMVWLMVMYLTPSGMGYSHVMAVAPFDNETNDPQLSGFASGLTDNLVHELTVRSENNYWVIGNAAILRVPREQRDLLSIGTSLHADYVVLGQVQSNGEQLRILAHLIRLPDQTHIWVVRLDRPRGDELKLEADLAAQIAVEFAARMAQQPEKAPSFAPGSH